MKTTWQLVLGAGLTIAAGSAWPADGSTGDTAIEQIVVVAHKMERPLRDVAAHVTVLEAADLGQEMAMSMADVLRYVPGVDAEGGGTRFGTEGVNIRGIGGNRVALLVDGVPLSDQFAVGSFSNATRDFVNAGFVDRAEVLHGPASALYGSAAIGGVVALRSPDPRRVSPRDGGGGHLATAWRDADSSLHATAMQSLIDGGTGVLLGLSFRDGEGFESAADGGNPDRRDYTRRSALLKVVADGTRGNSWRFGYYGQDSAVDTRLGSMLGTGRFASTTAYEGDDRARMDLLAGEFRFGDPDRGPGEGRIRAYVSRTDTEQFTRDERGLAARPVSIERRFGFEQSIRGMEASLQKRWTGRYASHETVLGIEYRRRRTEEFRDALETGIADGLTSNVLLGEVFPLRDFPVSVSADRGIYAEDTISVGDWTLIAGIRADRYDLEPASDRMYSEDYPFAVPVSVSVDELSPKAGVVYRPLPQLDAYLQYAHGYRAPPYEDANIGLELPLFNVRAVPNPDLRSEESDGIEFGVRWHGARSSARLAFFRTRYDDFIESRVRIGTDPGSGRILFQSRNVDAAKIAGVELGGSMTIESATGSLVLDAAAYRARGENHDSGQPLNSVGPAEAVVGADWQPAAGGWALRLQCTLTAGWSERDETAGELFSPPGHAVIDVFASRPLGHRALLRAGLTNLTDRTYWSWTDVRGLGTADPALPALARPGRSVVVGMDFNW